MSSKPQLQAIDRLSQPSHARYRVRWTDDEGLDQPLEWLIKGLLAKTGVALIYGPPKCGKSFIALDIAARLASGLPWFDKRKPREPIGTLMLLGEGQGTLPSRINAFSRRHGIRRPRMAFLGVSNLSHDKEFNAVREAVRETCQTMSGGGSPLGLIIIDTLASALGLQDENSAAEVTAAMQKLERLAAEFGTAIICVHHAGKSGRSRGSSALSASCDVVFSVERHVLRSARSNSARTIKVELNRNGDENWAALFRLREVVLGEDEDGENITSCVVEFVNVNGETVKAECIEEFISRHFDLPNLKFAGIKLPDGELGLTRPILEKIAAPVFRDKSADALKKAVQRVVTDLLEAGRIREIEARGQKILIPIPENFCPSS